MKIVLLAGGFGTRLSEYTKVIPKPMIDTEIDPEFPEPKKFILIKFDD